MVSNWKSLVVATYNAGHECRAFFFCRARPWNKTFRHVFLTWMVVQRIGKSPGVISGEDWLVKQTIHSATASAVSI